MLYLEWVLGLTAISSMHFDSGKGVAETLPLNHFAYASSDLIGLAAKYTTGIVQNHPFIDGNKRTGFVIGVLLLELNGYQFTASEEAAARAVLELAESRVRQASHFISGSPERPGGSS